MDDELTTKDLILLTVQDLVVDFVAYDRRDDEELTRERLIDAINGGVVTIDEIADRFKTVLEESLR